MKATRDLKKDEDYRRAAAEYRVLAESGFAEVLNTAYKKFMQANAGKYPATVSELQPFFDQPVDDSMLQRYEMEPSSNFPEAKSKLGVDWVISLKSPVDKEFDYRMLVGADGGFINWLKW